MEKDLDTKLLERSIENLVAKHGYIKVNLERDDGTSEGLWAVPCSDQDELLARCEDPEIKNKPFKCRLCNEPIGTWYGRSWGEEITARNNGSYRPYAKIEDNFTPREIDKIFDL